MESFYKKHPFSGPRPNQPNQNFPFKSFCKVFFFWKACVMRVWRTESGSEEPCLFGSGYRLWPRHDLCGEDDALSVGRAAFEVLMGS